MRKSILLWRKQYRKKEAICQNYQLIERDAFLQERGHLARIATLQADGSPSVVPVWFVYEDGKIIITPRKYSAFWTNIQKDARVAITIDEESGVYRKVLVEGKAEILYPLGHDDEWRDIYRRITQRYVDRNLRRLLSDRDPRPAPRPARCRPGIGQGHDLAHARRRRTVQWHLGHALLRTRLQNARPSCIRRR